MIPMQSIKQQVVPTGHALLRRNWVDPRGSRRLTTLDGPSPIATVSVDLMGWPPLGQESDQLLPDRSPPIFQTIV